MSGKFIIRQIVIFFVMSLATHEARATSVVPPTFDGLVAQADYIVRAVVKSVNAQLYDEGAHRHRRNAEIPSGR